MVRELFVLGRRFDEAGPVRRNRVLPDGLHARPFRPGHDEAEWLRVNAAAFAHHPEQGRMTRADLDARMARALVRPRAGLILVVRRGRRPTRWPPSTGPRSTPTRRRHRPGRPAGEVYVVGVDPAYQGQGSGAAGDPRWGWQYLRRAGVPEDVILYVDGDNPAALKVYRGLGFTTRSVDRDVRRAGPVR